MSAFTVSDVLEAVHRARFDTGVDAVRVSPRTMDDLRRSFSRDTPPPHTLPSVVFGARLIVDSTVPDGVLAPVERPARPSLAAFAFDFAAAALASLDESPRVTLPSPDAMRLDASRAEADAELAEWRALLDTAKGRRG